MHRRGRQQGSRRCRLTAEGGNGEEGRKKRRGGDKHEGAAHPRFRSEPSSKLDSIYRRTRKKREGGGKKKEERSS